MSFILEDKKLLNMLVRYAQQQQLSADDIKAFRGLLANLEKQVTVDPNAGPVITTGSGLPAALDSTHLKNLSQLINFLGMSGIQIDGQNIVVGETEKPDDPSYIPFEVMDTSVRPTRVAATMKVNKDLLSKYLQHLQGNLIKTPNPTLSAQINNIIQEANEQLDANISDKYQQPAKTLRSDQLLDKIPQNFKTDNPLVDGNIPLTYGDITSDTAFNAWTQKNNISIDGRLYKHPQYDKCGLIKSLFARASRYLQDAATAQDKEVYTIYRDKIPDLASAFKCDLGSTTQQDKKPDGQAGSGVGGDSPAVISQLAQELPLSLNDIDFTRIENFLSGYEKIISSNTDPRRASQVQTVNTAIQQARQYMQLAQQQTINGNMSNFPLNGLTSGDLVAWAVPPTSQGQQPRSRGSARALCDYLDYTVRNVASVVRNFYYSYVNDMRGQQIFANEPQLRNAVDGQAAVATSNLNRLGAARDRLPQVGA